MRLVFKYLYPYRVRMTVGLIIKIVGTLAELFLPMILAHILDNVIAKNSIFDIVLYGGLMIAIAVAAAVCNIIANRMAARVSSDFSRAMRQALFDKTLSLSARQRDSLTIASLESRITSDTYNVHHFVGMMQRMGVRAPILLIGGVTITLIIDTYLSLVMLAILPIIFISVYSVSRRGVPLYSGVQRSVDSMVRVVREDTEGIRVIKALSKGDYERGRYDRVNRKLMKDERRAGIIMGIINPTMTLLMNLGICAVVGMSAYRALSDSTSSANVIAFIQYFTLISMAMLSMSRIFVMFTRSSASAKRIEEVINLPADMEILEKSDTGEGEYIISFENVSFSYLGARNNLTNISFKLGRGESLGIIGATGSGKSTIIKLLLRFYDINEGRILINGIDIKSYTKEELSALFGTALQNDFLFSDTIEENISFARDLTHCEVERAAKIAMAHDFIMEKEGGYSYTIAPKGTNLSGGQKQRLLIARAIAKMPPIIILDDSSSALDYKTDAEIRKNMRQALGDTTLITVAQRVSSVMTSDKILVIDEGRVIGAGTHEELLLSCPEYQEISDSQIGGAFID